MLLSAQGAHGAAAAAGPVDMSRDVPWLTKDELDVLIKYQDFDAEELLAGYTQKNEQEAVRTLPYDYLTNKERTLDDVVRRLHFDDVVIKTMFTRITNNLESQVKNLEKQVQALLSTQLAKDLD